MSSELKFAEESSDDPNTGKNTWPLLIVDDEQEVHTVTTLALQEFRFLGRGLRFLHAYSGAEAKRLLKEQPGIALVLLDVVMETEHAGLDVVQYVRNELDNKFVRIILRTGQPGQAPELEMITRYDINDYKHKTELTSARLFTTLYTGLSTYRDLTVLDANRRGLEKVIDALARINELRSLEYFAQGVLEQLTALLFLDRDALMVHAAASGANAGDYISMAPAAGIAARGQTQALQIVAATGAFSALVGRDGLQVLPPDVLERIQTARGRPGTHYGAGYFIGDQPDAENGELLFYIGANRTFSRPDGDLIEKFCKHVGIAYGNLRKLNLALGRRQKVRDG